jgi:hypothetical protein
MLAQPAEHGWGAFEATDFGDKCGQELIALRCDKTQQAQRDQSNNEVQGPL